MSLFPLKIVTPDGLIYDGQAEKLIVRTTSGDVAILARHVNYVTPLGMGQAVVVTENSRRTAACIGGMLSVMNGEVTLDPPPLNGRTRSMSPGQKPAISGLKKYSRTDLLLKPTFRWHRPVSAVP